MTNPKLPPVVIMPEKSRHRGASALSIIEHEIVHINQILTGAFPELPKKRDVRTRIKYFADAMRTEYEANLLQLVRWPALYPTDAGLSLDHWCMLRGYADALEATVRLAARDNLTHTQAIRLDGPGDVEGCDLHGSPRRAERRRRFKGYLRTVLHLVEMTKLEPAQPLAIGQVELEVDDNQDLLLVFDVDANRTAVLTVLNPARADKVPVRAADILSAEGLRAPGSDTAQKTFKMGVYLLKEGTRDAHLDMLQRAQAISDQLARESVHLGWQPRRTHGSGCRHRRPETDRRYCPRPVCVSRPLTGAP